MPRLTFLPSGVVVDVPAGTTVFAAAQQAEVVIPSQCGGMCACALCRVKVVEGTEHLVPMRDNERAHLGNVFFLTRERLSCQLVVNGDLVVEIPELREKVKKKYIPYSVVRRREAAEAEADARRTRSEPPSGRSGRGSFAERFRLDSDDGGFTGDPLLGERGTDLEHRPLFRQVGPGRAPAELAQSALAAEPDEPWSGDGGQEERPGWGRHRRRGEEGTSDPRPVAMAREFEPVGEGAGREGRGGASRGGEGRGGPARPGDGRRSEQPGRGAGAREGGPGGHGRGGGGDRRGAPGERRGGGRVDPATDRREPRRGERPAPQGEQRGGVPAERADSRGPGDDRRSGMPEERRGPPGEGRRDDDRSRGRGDRRIRGPGPREGRASGGEGDLRPAAAPAGRPWREGSRHGPPRGGGGAGEERRSQVRPPSSDMLPAEGEGKSSSPGTDGAER